MALPSPLFMRYSKLTLATPAGEAVPEVIEFQCSSTSIGLTSEGGDLTSISTLCPDGSFSESTPRTWSLTVTGVQDVESVDSFLWYLMDNDGATADATFYPKTDNAGLPVGRGYEGVVTIAPPDIVGGVEPGNYATFTAVLPFIGKPAPIDAAGAPITLTAATASAPASKSSKQPEPVAS